MSLSSRYANASSFDIRTNFVTLQEAVELLDAANSKEAEKYLKRLQAYYAAMSNGGGQ